MIVNGTFVLLEKRQSLYDFLSLQNYEITTLAVERNGEFVPKATYKDVLLENEDKLEIVKFVGGG